MIADQRFPVLRTAVAAVGTAVPWIAHKCLPGSTDLKADLTAPYSVKNGLVLGQNIVDADASVWTKLTKGTKDAATFGTAFLDACAAHRHWGQLVSSVWGRGKKVVRYLTWDIELTAGLSCTYADRDISGVAF